MRHSSASSSIRRRPNHHWPRPACRAASRCPALGSCGYLGSEALALGLIDGEGSRTEGIQAAAELANLRNYAVVDLEKQLGIPALPPPTPASQPPKAMLAAAPPGTIFMLDSRIPLPEQALPPALRNLKSKRDGDTVVPATGSGPTWAGTLLSPSLQKQPAGD